MFIKRYTVAAFLLMALVGWYVYAYITQGSMGIDLFGIPLPSLRIAIWIVLPMFVLYLASVAHMSFYSLLGSFKLRKYEKDYEKLIDAIIESLLGKKERNHQFKTPRYNLLGAVVDNSVIFPTNLKADTDNEKLNNIIKLIEDIKNGEVVELKQYSLKMDNQLYIQNQKNMYKKGNLSAEDILGNQDKYNSDFCKEVYQEFVKTAPIASINKYKELLDKESLFMILTRINANENTIIANNDIIISLCESVELNSADYIKIAILASKDMNPDQRIKLFELISETKEEAMDAYLFTLFDLEMISPADAILNNSQKGEYDNFKAYRALKECNKNFNIKLFI